MSRYIELIDKYRIEQSEYDTDYNPPNYIWTDNTGEVIRCEDCVYANLNELSALFMRCKIHNRNVNMADYCSWAERRES